MQKMVFEPTTSSLRVGGASTETQVTERKFKSTTFMLQ